MEYLRSGMAVVAGYALLAVIIIIGSLAAAWAFSATSGAPGASYLAANLVISLLGAVAGGALAAMLAPRAAFAHSLALAAIIFGLGMLIEGRPGQASWYQMAIPIIGAAGAVAGGYFAARRRAAPAR